MKYSYDLCGAEPIIKDEPVYDAALIAYGELLMLSAGTFSAGGGGHQLVTAVPSTVMADIAVNAVGISLEGKDTDDSPSIACAINGTTTAGCQFVKTIINPFAVYRAMVSTAAGLAVAASASTNEIQCTGVTVDDFDGCWLAFTASAGPNYGQVRRVVTSATAATLDLSHVANSTITTADTFTLFSPKLTYPQMLNGAATMVGQTTVAGYGVTNLRVVENYMGGEIMKELKHDAEGYENKGGIDHLEQDLMMKDHLYGVQEA